MAGDVVAPRRLLRLGFRTDVPYWQQVLACGARLDEVITVDRRVDGAFVVDHGLDDGAGLGDARREREGPRRRRGGGSCGGGLLVVVVDVLDSSSWVVYEPGFWSKSRDARRGRQPSCAPGLWPFGLGSLSATMLTVRVAFVFDECALVSDAATATVASSAISGFSFPEQRLGTAVGSFPRPVASLGVAATAVSVDFSSHGKSCIGCLW